jgi:hypothetical protein
MLSMMSYCRAAVQRATTYATRRMCTATSPAGHKTLTDFEKRIMVWGGGFKNKASVPASVPRSAYVKCQEWFRIKMNVVAMGMTLMGCGVMMHLGKQDKENGLTWHKEVLNRHVEHKSSSE